jgi:hypothetical protein
LVAVAVFVAVGTGYLVAVGMGLAPQLLRPQQQRLAAATEQNRSHAQSRCLLRYRLVSQGGC